MKRYHAFIALLILAAIEIQNTHILAQPTKSAPHNSNSSHNSNSGGVTGGRHPGVFITNNREKPEDSIPFAQLLPRLHSVDAKMREQANEAIENIPDTLTQEQMLQLLRAATLPYPPRATAYDQKRNNTSALLVQRVAIDPKPAYVPVVLEVFAKLSNQAKLEALRMLIDLATEHNDQNAIVAFMSIFKSYAPTQQIPPLEEWVTVPLQENPRYASIIFPKLLDYASQASLADTIYETCLWYCDAGLVSLHQLRPYESQILKHYVPQRNWLMPRQRDSGVQWMWTETYQQRRSEVEVLLDLLGYLPTPQVRQELRQALHYHDPRLKCFALLSLLRQGQPVERPYIEQVAASDEMRIWLYNNLAAAGKLALFPRSYRTQKALATSDMVNWLIFPTELARVPDQIQLMRVVPVQREKNQIVEYYIFRFRVQGNAEGWLAGWAGPYPKGQLAVSGEGTFSSFEAWSSKTIEQLMVDLKKRSEDSE